MTELEDKVDRTARVARENGVDGILISRQSNFAWLSCGQSNRIDGSMEAGAGSLFITGSGGRYIVANTIEMPRLFNESLAGHDFQPIEYPWPRDHADPAAPAAAVRSMLGSAVIGADVPSPATLDLSGAIAAVHVPLTKHEVNRYRVLGRDVATAVERLCRTVQPGVTEQEVVARLISVVASVGARAVVTLVGSDERIAQYRHPVPTGKTWTNTLLVGLCAERGGLVVALSRIVATKAAAADLVGRTEATAQVFARLLANTREGASGAELFEVAADAYRAVGHPGQEALHHQGGAIGYRSRDWIAHPHSHDVVQSRQAFAWNPSITGTKVEDTALLLDDAIEIVTTTSEWPSIETSSGEQRVKAPGILVI